MKEKKTKETTAKSESISDREHDEKKDLSFLNLPTNARENAEGFGVYKEYNHNY